VSFYFSLTQFLPYRSIYSLELKQTTWCMLLQPSVCAVQAVDERVDKQNDVSCFSEEFFSQVCSELLNSIFIGVPRTDCWLVLSWLLCRGGLGRLTFARWAGGPPSRWAATSNVEVGQTTYPFNGWRVWSEGQSHKEELKEGWSGMWNGARGSLSSEGELYLDVCAGAHWVPSYATADGAGLPT